MIDSSTSGRLWLTLNRVPFSHDKLHPFCQQRPIVKYCEENGIAVQAYSPLVRGQLDHPVLQRLAKKVPLFYERRHYSGGS